MIPNCDPEIELLDILCPSNLNAIDVGANKGVYSDALLSHCNKLFAYEPLPNLAFLLKERYKKRSQVTIKDLAISDNIGKAVLNIPRYKNPNVNRDSFVEGWSSIYKDYSDLRDQYPDKFPEIKKLIVSNRWSWLVGQFDG